MAHIAHVARPSSGIISTRSNAGGYYGKTFFLGNVVVHNISNERATVTRVVCISRRSGQRQGRKFVILSEHDDSKPLIKDRILFPGFQQDWDRVPSFPSGWGDDNPNAPTAAALGVSEEDMRELGDAFRNMHPRTRGMGTVSAAERYPSVRAREKNAA